MKAAPGTPRGRRGFTLIELLVVLTIIAILIALLGAAVFKAFEEAHRLQVRNDISQLSNALGAFKSKFGTYPPSQIKLGFMPGAPYYGNTQLDVDSISFIKRMFPRAYDTWASTGIAWNPNWSAGTPAVTLHGDQALVFFLGGIQSNGVCMGFDTNPQHPEYTTSSQRIGPFYDFSASRLKGPYTDTLQGTVWTRSTDPNGFFVYNDSYGASFAYFSSYVTRNNYNRYGTSDCPVQPSPNSTPPIYAAYLPNGAYWQSKTSSGSLVYWNPETFQIISAGANNNFGPGGQWDPTNLWQPSSAQTVSDGKDDMCNFYDNQMGIQQ